MTKQDHFFSSTLKVGEKKRCLSFDIFAIQAEIWPSLWGEKITISYQKNVISWPMSRI